MSRFQARPYQDGDGPKLNALYEAVTGRVRSLRQFGWQWLEAPEGQGEMWIIEEVPSAGPPVIIGHHGLMPLAFSHGAREFRAGKTENTMVHPDYRRRILYPKYERDFLRRYSERFDLLFSTVGPAPAIRQRKALGYDASRVWRKFEIALRPGAFAGLLSARLDLSGRVDSSALYRCAAPVIRGAAGLARAIPRRRSGAGLALTALTAAQAVQHDFFREFWPMARGAYPMTPRRDRADLAWRYWTNPNVDYTALITPDPTGVQGYAVLSRPHGSLFRLEDIVVFPYETPAFRRFLHSVCDWCAGQGGMALSFVTTDDPASPGEMIAAADLPRLESHRLMSRFQPAPDQPMLRRATERGIGRGAAIDNWYVSPILMEGRV